MRPAIITGGIGTGKSTVCKKLAQMGVRIIDADSIAHEILDEESLKIGQMFGDECVSNMKVVRKKLGEIVFSDPAKRKALEEFIHPIVRKRIYEQWRECQENREDCILDIPLYFEGKHRYNGFFVIVVYATLQQQRQRLKERDGLDEQAIQKRLDAQWPIEEKCKNAHWVVDNSGDLSALDLEVKRLYRWLKESNANSQI